ncbi:MAG: 4Fe-4S ferredoxin [Proteobacteria bacterium]|nr:4Fe-4S ferredoxin [Pseudomonadota bacterium]MBU1716455.1 4Fe-4S ferredoxin [Pseudomonadota bacterium]
MKVKRKVIEIDQELCNGCGECVPSCAEGSLVIVDGKAKMIADKYCDGLGACLGHCPTGALRIIEREADEFDEAAVEELLAGKKKAPASPPPITPPVGGCPGGMLKTFAPMTPCQAANQPVSNGDLASTSSALSHWPVQIRLVPPTAPFLKNADLLVAADCTPLAYPNFHRDFLSGRVVMLGCPKFDDVDSYVQKFAEIFTKASIKSVLIVIMEVPCCANMRAIIREALKVSGQDIKVEEAVISARGEVISRGKMG